MRLEFNRHTNLKGLHATFSPSQSAWLRYDDEKVKRAYSKKQAARRGTELHEWAKKTIDLGIKQPELGKTLYMYVNDAIGFRMDTEVVLFYSPHFFGTADTITFRDNVLRIHDLKTGEERASMEQLMVYAALFCLEYKIRPSDILIELRLYQSNNVQAHNPTADEIVPIMDRIVHIDKILTTIESEV